jgi:hypothetical protein
MPRLSREQSQSLARWVRSHHPKAGDAVEVVEPDEKELGFAVRGDDCIEWGMSTQRGYGQIGINGRTVRVHRALREVVEGESELPALHGCGNKRCINLDHTYYGTHSENMEDQFRLAETRQYGETHNRAKLTQAQVDDIRARYVRGQGHALDLEYGLSRGYASTIAKGSTWGR